MSIISRLSSITFCIYINHFRYLIHHLLNVSAPLPVCLQSSVTSYVQSSVTSCRHRYHFLCVCSPLSLPMCSPLSLPAGIVITSCVSAVLCHFLCAVLCHFLCAVLCHFLPASLSLPVCLQSSVTSYVQSSVTSYVQSSVTSCRHRYHFLYLRRLLCRLFIILMVVVSVAWVPIIKETSGGQVFIYINEVINYLAPPFAAVFLLAVLVPRVNEKVRTVCYTVMSCCSQDCVLHCHVLL